MADWVLTLTIVALVVFFAPGFAANRLITGHRGGEQTVAAASLCTGSWVRCRACVVDVRAASRPGGRPQRVERLKGAWGYPGGGG